MVADSRFQTEEESRFIDKRRSNIKSDLIEITEDKLENILLKHIQYLGTHKSWLIPASIFVTLLLANLTATFKTTFGLESAVWQALFLILAAASGVWLLCSIVHIIANWKKASLDNLIATIKNAEDIKQLSMRRTLTIIKALYGTESIYEDITEILRSKIRDDTVKEIANNSLAGKDPSPNQVKTLQAIS